MNSSSVGVYRRQREYPRIASSIPVSMSLPNGTLKEIMSTDFSEGGFGALEDDPPEPGTVLSIEFSGLELDTGVRTQAEVVWRRPSSTAESKQAFGARFFRVEPKAHSKIQEIVASLKGDSILQIQSKEKLSNIVVGYYDEKTASIINKYGPGPRIHFHIGLFDHDVSTHDSDLESLRRLLVDSQEKMIDKAAEVWEASKFSHGNILDAGCGLGGGSIYWAKEFNADVTAVTIVPGHIPLITEFADRAGVSERVHPLLSDVCDVPGERCFDAAIAMEASCYFPLKKWFARLAHLLRPGGVVCVEEPLVGKEEWATLFDHYWRTKIASVDEYVDAAAPAGFVLEKNVDLTDETTEFWSHSQAWVKMNIEHCDLDEKERTRLLNSLAWHALFHQAWSERGIEIRLLRFRCCA